MAATIQAARRALNAARTLRELAGADPTPEQRTVLEAFPGWGPAAPLFDGMPTGTWAQLADEFEDFDAEAMSAAGRIVDTSFYTPPALITHIYELLRSAGFDGGRVLDLGCGTARFLSHAPQGLTIDYTGVEADPVAAGIAGALHPEACIHAAELQTVTLRNDFDVVVGNVPFSESSVYDKASGYHSSLHGYFLSRAVEAVRPGGYVVVITSRHTLDSATGLSGVLRERADLVAALRLPGGYFAGEGTDVIADVVVLRVRDHHQIPSGWRPPNPATVTLAGIIDGRHRRTAVSAYWDSHPQHVAGQMTLTGFDRNPLAVLAEDPEMAVAEAFAAVAPTLIPYEKPSRTANAEVAAMVLADAQGRKEGSLHLIEGTVRRVVAGALTDVARPTAELQALIELRDAAMLMVAADADWSRPDDDIEPLRLQCAALYGRYVERFGPLNRGELKVGAVDPKTGIAKLSWKTPRLGGFREDPDSSLVLALEDYDQDSGAATPAAILQRRVNRPPVRATRADNPQQALSITLGEGRGLDLERIAELLSLDGPDAALDALGELVFRDPQAKGLPVIARDYLSGNVRVKLRAAEAAAHADASYERNVTALREIQPTWLSRDEIRIELGSPFVSAADIEDFCEEVFDARPTVTHIGPLAEWEVDGPERWLSDAAKLAYCTSRRNAFELLQTALRGASPVVYDEVIDPRTRAKRRVRNADETEQAELKAAAIAERFSLWVWENAERETRIVTAYNETMNSRVKRKHDGSYLSFPGLAEGIEPWPWQRDFVDMAISTPGTMAAHEMSLGKGLTIQLLAATLRQFGLANRVACIVPGHLLEQTARTARQSFPAENVLVINRSDLHGAARRRFMARCVTGDFRLIILTHETFSAIPVSVEDETAWYDDQLGELESYLRGGGSTGKQIARQVRSHKAQLEKLRDRTNDPDILTWELLGIDYLCVDEVDKFRRLPIACRAEGFSLGASDRAADLHMKVSLLRRADPRRPHVGFFTGSPFTNTLAEAFVWTKYLAPHLLTESGMEHFDAWAATFIRYEQLVEVSPDGSGFRSKWRPAVIQNAPELLSMLEEFMSMVSAEMAGLPRPAAIRHTVVVEPTEQAREFMDTLIDRAEAIRRRQVRDGRIDNMLVICSQGRAVALDPALVGVGGAATKLDAAAANIADIYHRTRHIQYPDWSTPGAFQLVLCDLGTPKDGDAQSYGRIRAGLIARGVPADTIRFVHEATTPKAREAIFAACRNGSCAVLLGSTPKAGIGTNIQLRLHSVHRVDIPWTPAAWEQGNARALRYGNSFTDTGVGIYSYVSEYSFDARSFDIIERKARSFEVFYRGSAAIEREIDDVGEAVLNFAELKAAASGNTLLLKQHELAVRVRKLRLAQVTTRQNVQRLRNEAEAAEWRAGELGRRLAALRPLVASKSAVAGADLKRTAAAVCEPGRFVASRFHRWTDGRTTVGFVKTGGFFELLLTYGSHNVWSEVLPWRTRRRGAVEVEQWAREVVDGWIRWADAELVTLQSTVAEAQHRAVQARAAADAVDLSDPPELVAACRELKAIEAQIREELDESDTPPAAA